MKKLLVIMLALGLAQAAFCQMTTGQKLDELIYAYYQVNKFNGSVLIAQKGKIILQKGYGLKDFKTNSRNDVNTIFQIYSVTKTFTSTVVLQLIELGRLSLSDKLSKFYPGFPKGDSISIEHLLTHTSGIYDYTHGNNMPDQSEKSFIKFLATKPLNFSPGQSWDYSNSGYWLLGFIIQKITRMSYEEAVHRYILKPLHMDHSGFDYQNLKDKDKSTGYEIFTRDTKKEAEIYEAPGPFSAGALYSTVTDLLKYHKGLQSHKIISEMSLKKAYTPVKNDYGLGWMIRNYEGNEIFSHSGGAAGFRSNFVRIPKKDICVILLSNNENSNTEMITKNIVNILIQKEYILPSEIPLSTEILNRYVGYYRVNPTFSMHISTDDGRLVAQASGQGQTVLLAKKPTYFYAEEANGFIEFNKDKQDKWDELIIHQGGQDVIAKRFSPTWGLLGSATDIGWEGKIADIELKEDSLKTGVWNLSNINLSTGEFKFRFNNDWNINYGGDSNDGILEMYGGNIKIESGTYNLTLDLSDSTKPKYSIKKVR